MKVTILKDSERKITSHKSGKPVEHKFQEIFVKWGHEPFPRPAQIYIPADRQFYPPGEYEFDVENSLAIEKDRLGVRDIVLKPTAASAGKSSGA